MRLVGVLGTAIVGLLDTENEFLARRTWIVIASASVGAANDILIAGALSRNLYYRKKIHADMRVSERYNLNFYIY